MQYDLKTEQVKPIDEFIIDSDRPFTEDSHSVSEYACMYYMLTPVGCNQTGRSWLWD